MSTVGMVDGRTETRALDLKKDKSVFDDKTVSNDYKSGGAYKKMLNMFAEQLEVDRFAEHCRKFFKGDKNERKDTD